MPGTAVDDEVDEGTALSAVPVSEIVLDECIGAEEEWLAIPALAVGHVPLTCKNLLTVDKLVDVTIRAMPVTVASGRVKVP